MSKYSTYGLATIEGKAKEKSKIENALIFNIILKSTA